MSVASKSGEGSMAEELQAMVTLVEHRQIQLLITQGADGSAESEGRSPDNI